jgi:signal transduction histidine kinase
MRGWIFFRITFLYCRPPGWLSTKNGNISVMKLSTLVFFGFLLILIMFSATTYINFRLAERVNENSEFVSNSASIVRTSNRFQRNMLNMVSGLRGYLFTGENYFIQSYDSAEQENIEILASLAELIPENSVQGKSIGEIQQLNKEWRTNFAAPLIQAKRMAFSSDSSQTVFTKMYREKLASGTEMTLNRKLQQKIRDLGNYEYNLRDIRRKELMESISFTRKTSFYLTTLSILLGIAIAIFLAYRISTRIMKMVNMADTIASGDYEAKSIDQGSDELGRLGRSLNHMAVVLSQNIALLQRKNEELGQFAHIVSHDLKAPLRGIDNVVTWIEEDHSNELSPKLKEYIQLIRGRLMRAENLIQGILMYARIGRENPSRENVDLNALFEEITDTLAVPPGFKIFVQQHLPEIYTERVPLQQVLSNLIINAIKYNDKTDGQVEVRFHDAGSHYVFTVRDNGPGIDEAYHDKIFMIFQTLQDSDSLESTGIGLAIVKKILDDRNQTIRLTSKKGKGTSFIFTWTK